MGIFINSIFFIIFSCLLGISAILSIVSKKIIYILLWAMIVFLMIGGLFILLGAMYNAMVQFLIYVVAIPILIAVSIMLIKQNSDKRRLIRGKHFVLSFLGIFFLVLIIGEFLALNNDIFEIIRSCFVYVNPYSDLISISKNILGSYPILLFEFGLGIILTIIGLCHYEK